MKNYNLKLTHFSNLYTYSSELNDFVKYFLDMHLIKEDKCKINDQDYTKYEITNILGYNDGNKYYVFCDEFKNAMILKRNITSKKEENNLVELENIQEVIAKTQGMIQYKAKRTATSLSNITKSI